MSGKFEWWALGGAFFVVVGCSHADELMTPAVTAEGPTMKDKRALDKFDRIRVDNAIQVDVKLGKENSAVVESATSLARLISTKVDGDTLNIELTQRAVVNGTIKVHVIAQTLDGIEANGASKVYAFHMLSEKGMNLRANGASVLEVAGKLGPGRLDVDGGTRTKLSGTAGDFSISAGGASAVNATDLTCSKLTVDAEAASTIDVGPADQLTASAGGASQVHYLGNPTIASTQANDASTISHG